MMRIPRLAGVLLAAFALVALLPGSSQATNIAWVTFHSAEDSPSAGAAGAGFTSAPDIGYTQLLTANGYNVTRFVTHDDPTTTDADFLNGFDLIIIGRSINSGHFQQANETAFWNNTITKPVIDMAGYTLRNSRLGYTSGGTMLDTSGPMNLTVNDPANPIFAGVALDGTNTMVNPFAHIVTYDTTTTRGISVNTDPVVGGGTVLATDGTAGDAAFGGMMIGEWQAGGTTATGDVLAAHRLAFLSGSREASGISSETAGIFDLDPDGQQLFLNAVNYMAVPEPSALALLGFAGLSLVTRRKRA